MSTQPHSSESQEASTDQSRPNGLVVIPHFIRDAIFENAGLKFVALILALTVFILVHSEDADVYHPWVRITYLPDSERVLVSPRVDQVLISVRGSRRRIKRLQKESLDNIRIDLSKQTSGDLRLSPEMFDLPEGIEIVSVTPPRLTLAFDERSEKWLPVRLDTIGTPEAGFRVGSHTAAPDKVRVTGAKSKLAKLNWVKTVPINLSGRTKSFSESVALLDGDYELENEQNITVTVHIIEEVQARHLPKKTVVAVAPASIAGKRTYLIKPPVVSVTMYGAAKALEAIDGEKVQVLVDVLTTDTPASEARQAELRVQPALSDVAYKISPSTVTIEAQD